MTADLVAGTALVPVAVLSLPAMREWMDAARAEVERVLADEA